ncbi:MAG: phosphatase PAP2 family protein [Caldilinea sp.]|uniref:phosphatase PAP2 family protein n=1 Tax=Caldilinea sp. TaxID=2293560 RepID=UPI002B6BA496|nr:phosphatase PAP2 family protein [Anaerolineales bacterium]HQY93379.1 phosphatase PAP2 family protein [Caldilinea sp.]HRA65460.1 phosphatase PAP2 family protein [Caldilinea sp.]
MKSSTLFWGALLFVAGAFAGLTLLVATMPSFAIDLQITQAVQSISLPAFALLMRLVSWPGFNPQVMIIAGLIILVLYGWGLRWEAVMALIAAVFTTAVNLLVKNLIQRPRPLPDQVTVVATLTSYSFPSGHVMFYVGFFGFIGFLAYRLLRPSLRRSLLLALFGGLVLLIGISRIYLGEHWASDVLGSYLLGSLMLVAIIQVYLWGRTRYFVRQPVAATDRCKQ